MTRHEPDSTSMRTALELLSENGFEGMARALEILLNEAMRLERSEFLGAGPYERSAERRGYANGYKGKRVKTRAGELDLKVPQVRELAAGEDGFYPRALERGLRSERALTLAVAEMFVQGVSTRKVTEITRELCGLEITSTQVSRAAAMLDEELDRWRTRELGETPYLVLDATYEKVRHGGSVVSCAVLIAIGVRADGKRTVLGVSVSLSEAEAHWRKFLASLLDRGLRGVRMITSDDHAGLRAALRATFHGVAWQRCQVHLQRNAASYVPKKSMQAEVAEALRGVFGAPSRQEAERILKSTVKAYSQRAPKLAQWMEENVPEGLAVLDLPPSHRRRLATSNALERLHREVNRRTRVATLFPNEASLLRLVSAVLAEVSEEWETGRIYLTIENE